MFFYRLSLSTMKFELMNDGVILTGLDCPCSCFLWWNILSCHSCFLITEVRCSIWKFSTNHRQCVSYQTKIRNTPPSMVHAELACLLYLHHFIALPNSSSFKIYLGYNQNACYIHDSILLSAKSIMYKFCCLTMILLL